MWYQALSVSVAAKVRVNPGAVCGLDWQANRKPLINASNIFDIDGPGDFTTFELQQPDGNSCVDGLFRIHYLIILYFQHL